MTLTSKGATALNEGKSLGEVSLTASSGDPVKTTTASVEPNVTYVDDAATLTLETQALTEDAVSENTVVLSYEANDEDTETVTVAFTVTNTEGYYQLDTENNQVTLTSKGATALNEGKNLGEVSLTASSGDPVKTTTASVEPNVTYVDDAATLTLETQALTEDAVSENTVVLSYEANDEDTETVTVAFTAGTNTEGYYQLDTENNQVTLTSKGATALNEGKNLGEVSLTASSGDPVKTTTASVEPNVTYVDDAATLTLETQALTEDAVSENTVVLSYEANDEDTETVTVAFTAGTNTEGYYQLDTENNQVTLTSKGATALNEGKNLGEVSLTASSGDPVKTTTASVEPNVTYVDDAATLTLETQALTEDAVSENTVVLSYEANDEDTETVTVAFTAGTNTEGYYQLDTENNQVTLTSKGATALNEGKSLGEVSLTASSGDPVKTTTASVEPNVTYVDDAATLTLETQALTEDAVSENTVVLSYEANDEDTETVTVAFTAGTNTEGYYQLDTENNQVTLTSKGATALNEGKNLGEVSLTASSGDPVKTTTASVEPNVTYVDDAATLTLETQALTEDAVSENTVVLSYEANDEDTETVTVAFTAGTNTEGYYQLDTENNQVTLTSKGATALNEGKSLGEVSLTASSGDPVKTTTASVEPNVTYVDDAATLTLETQALTEDAVSENTVVLSYEANDEDTETVTVAFTAGTNTEGYYQLDTENNQVTLTSKGATALNEGKSLGEVSLTASSGDPVKTTTASVEPNVTYVDDAATLTLETQALTEDAVSENTVVLSYEANDEDTETVTVAFTASTPIRKATISWTLRTIR